MIILRRVVHGTFYINMTICKLTIYNNLSPCQSIKNHGKLLLIHGEAVSSLQLLLLLQSTSSSLSSSWTLCAVLKGLSKGKILSSISWWIVWAFRLRKDCREWKRKLWGWIWKLKKMHSSSSNYTKKWRKLRPQAIIQLLERKWKMYLKTAKSGLNEKVKECKTLALRKKVKKQKKRLHSFLKRWKYLKNKRAKNSAQTGNSWNKKVALSLMKQRKIGRAPMLKKGLNREWTKSRVQQKVFGVQLKMPWSLMNKACDLCGFEFKWFGDDNAIYWQLSKSNWIDRIEVNVCTLESPIF